VGAEVVTYTVLVSQSIWSQAGVPPSFQCRGVTYREILDDAAGQYPPLLPYVGGGQIPLAASVVLFADGRQVEDVTAAVPGPIAELRIVLPSSGG